MEGKRNVLISGCGLALGDWSIALPLIKKLVEKYGRDNVYFFVVGIHPDSQIILYLLLYVLKWIKEENLISQSQFGYNENNEEITVEYRRAEMGVLKNVDKETFISLFNAKMEKLKELNFERVFIPDLRHNCEIRFLSYDITLIDIFEKILNIPIEWCTEFDDRNFNSNNRTAWRIPGRIETTIKRTLDSKFRYRFRDIFPEEYKLKEKDKHIDVLITPISSEIKKDLPINLVEYIIKKLKKDDPNICICINTHFKNNDLFILAKKMQIEYIYNIPTDKYMDMINHTKVVFSADSGPQSLATVLCIPEIGFHRYACSFFLDSLFDSKTRTICAYEDYITYKNECINETTLNDIYNYKITEEKRNEINTKIYLLLKGTLKRLKRE